MVRPHPPHARAHFAPVANWMNDPNGLIWWKGRAHLRGPVTVISLPQELIVGPDGLLGTASVAELCSGPLHIFYDGGICEVFSAAGQMRAEIFHDHPISGVTVRRGRRGQSRCRRPAAAPGTAGAWELQNTREHR